MRIGIDARLNAYRQAGIPVYTRSLLGALARQDTPHKWYALQHRRQQKPLFPELPLRRPTLVTPPHHRWESWALPLELLRLPLDLIHFPDFIAPPRLRIPAVITVHDLAFLRYPEILDDNAKRYYNQIGESVQRAAGIIAVSDSTKRDIIDLLGIAPERITRIYEAIAPIFSPGNKAQGETRVINGSTLHADSFALFVSTVEPRKNLPLLLHALRRCCDEGGSKYHLVIAGSRGWHDEPILALIDQLGLRKHVTLLLHRPSLDELLWLYRAARIYLNPSRYEGFGLPVLEAMACGTPTIVSSAPSLPEIAGDAALILSPDDAGTWAQAIMRWWENPHERAAWAKRGIQRAATFSWEQAARETVTLYEKVVRR